jgi:serine/threonine protein kinase
VDLLETLYVLHRACRLLHRDVAPRNVLIDFDNRAWLGDMGLSVYLHPFGVNEGKLDVRKYSLSTAPEMKQGTRDFDGVAEVWSWGTVLLAILTRSNDHCGGETGELKGKLSSPEGRKWVMGLVRKAWGAQEEALALASQAVRCLEMALRPQERRVSFVTLLRAMDELLGLPTSERKFHEHESNLIEAEQALERLQLQPTSLANMAETAEHLLAKADCHRHLQEASRQELTLERAITLLDQPGPLEDPDCCKSLSIALNKQAGLLRQRGSPTTPSSSIGARSG